MRCVICDWPAEVHVYVRPIAGGRRRGHFVCDESCKTQLLAREKAAGWEETASTLGYDVFVPIWEVWEKER